jgi:hypothetical protein
MNNNDAWWNARVCELISSVEALRKEVYTPDSVGWRVYEDQIADIRREIYDKLAVVPKPPGTSRLARWFAWRP